MQCCFILDMPYTTSYMLSTLRNFILITIGALKLVYSNTGYMHLFKGVKYIRLALLHTQLT